MKSKELREIIKKSATDYASTNSLSFTTAGSAIIFQRNGSQHGNFHNASFAAIIKNTDWSIRLNKIHTHPSVPSGTQELDSCHSSDALLMNVFCHPKFQSWKGVCNLFEVPSISNIKFGYNPKLLLKNGKYDTTEIDLCCDEFFAESKLTEANFTSKEKSIVENYSAFYNVFDYNSLNQNEDKYHNYQLIRNILSANQINKKFFLICDYRRTDLIKAFYDTVICIKDIKLRKNCGIVFWQEIADVSGSDLKDFLKTKYGF